MKKIILFLFVIALVLAPSALAQNDVDLYFFYGKTCPHCRTERMFLEEIEGDYPTLKIHELEVYYDSENAELFFKMCEAYGTSPYGVPMTFIGEYYITGYGSDKTTGRKIESRIKECINSKCINPGTKVGLVKEEIEDTSKIEEEAIEISKQNSVVQKILENNPNITPSVKLDDEYIVTWVSGAKVIMIYIDRTSKNITKVLQQELTIEKVEANATIKASNESEIIDIPVIGEKDLSKISLPLFTVTIGFLDGFNPCAMWVLCFLLTILIHAQSRKKMLLIGSIFVFASAFVYFIFMTAWLNFFLLVGYVNTLRIIIAVVAIAAGLINTKDFFFFKKGVSLTIPESAKPKLFEKMRALVHESALPAVILGTIVLAFTANTFELLCTAGFPAIYTRVLTLKALPTIKYYSYLALYNIIYIIPLAVIVGVFVVTMGAHRFTEKQGRWLKLIGGLLMLVLGLTLLIKPEILTFG